MSQTEQAYSRPEPDLADYAVLKADYVTPLPAGLDPVAAAPLMCTGLTAFNGLRKGGATAGSRVAVIGAGGIGTLAIRYAVAMGARVAVVGRSRRGEDNIETTIVVPGSFTSGTNHFTTGGHPGDQTVTPDYEAEYAGLMEQVSQRPAALAPADADVSQVDHAIVEVVDTGHGKRPFRVHNRPGRRRPRDRQRQDLLHPHD
ncbi:hypothetical protein [Streptomyces sp. V4I2]|uniref:hypothetical protein n=1 Tax=Streptomyces sp. V4I2 TaxID=3042280 RepID=UPI0027857356|nr:hypothetical protein [Streptomyces sp. V4I2]MDQ1042690.1 hypothetical protein [Streptomyces sp. V4I2]